MRAYSVSPCLTFSSIGQELDGCWLVCFVLLGVVVFSCFLFGVAGSRPFILTELSNNDYFSTAI